MAKEILFYKDMYSYTAEQFIAQMELCKGSDIVVRMNCPGGDPYAFYGMIAKYNEHKNGKKLLVDGQAKSGGFYFTCAVSRTEDVECLDVTDFMAHRAASYPWIENDPDRFTPEVKAFLTKINTDLRAIIESCCTAEQFKAVTGTSLDDMFSLDKRIDVPITPQQMKQLGIVKKINPLTAESKTQIMAHAAEYGVAAFSKEPETASMPPAPTTTTSTTFNKQAMTAAEFKAAHPAEYEKIVSEAHAAGVKAENKRAGAWLKFKDIDPEAVSKAVADVTAMVDMEVISDMSVKALAAGTLATAKKENAEDVTTAPVKAKAETEDQKTLNAFLAECKSEMGLATQ